MSEKLQIKPLTIKDTQPAGAVVIPILEQPTLADSLHVNPEVVRLKTRLKLANLAHASDATYDCRVNDDAMILKYPEGMPLARIAQLFKKLDKYFDRIGDDQIASCIDIVDHPNNTVYKYIILRKILSNASVNAPALQKSLSEALIACNGADNIDPEAFSNAFAVVSDYVQTGGMNNDSDEGLPKLDNGFDVHGYLRIRSQLLPQDSMLRL
jgi:hypothetical protein